MVASRPTSTINRPVAMGSKVPLCPIFLVFKMRRQTAIISCDEKSAGLSISKRPLFCGSGKFFNDILHHIGQGFGHLVHGFARYFKARGACMATAAKGLGNAADVHAAAGA